MSDIVGSSISYASPTDNLGISLATDPFGLNLNAQGMLGETSYFPDASSAGDQSASEVAGPDQIAKVSAGAASLLAAAVNFVPGIDDVTKAGISGAIQDAAAGAAAGSLLGPIGTVAGGLIGAAIGFFTGEAGQQEKDKQQQIQLDKELVSEQNTLMSSQNELANAKMQMGYYETAISTLPSELQGAETKYQQAGLSEYEQLLTGFGEIGESAATKGQEVSESGGSVRALAQTAAQQLGTFTGGSAQGGNLDTFNTSEGMAAKDANGVPTGIIQPANAGTYASGMAGLENQYYMDYTAYGNQVSQYQNQVIPTLNSTIAQTSSTIQQLQNAGASASGPMV